MTIQRCGSGKRIGQKVIETDRFSILGVSPKKCESVEIGCDSDRFNPKTEPNRPIRPEIVAKCTDWAFWSRKPNGSDLTLI